MAKKTKEYINRRGKQYQIERLSDGTIGRWIPQKKSAKAQKSQGKTVNANTKTKK